MLRLIFLLLALPLFLSSLEMQPLNPEAIAAAEIKAWKAYYKKDRITLIKAITTLISLQYPLKDPQTWSEIVPPLGLAMYRFGNMGAAALEKDYEKEVLPSLTEAYKALGTHLKADWNPEQVAKSDLEWWIMRRQPTAHNPEKVGKKISQLYQEIFGIDKSRYFVRAGYLRAAAARYRDICQVEWGSIQEEDWQIMEEMLIYSYKALDQGIKTLNK